MNARRPRRLDIAMLLGRILGSVLGLLAATWRVDGAAEVEQALDHPTKTPRLVGFWHGKYFPLFPLFRGLDVTIFVGEGFRGRLIATIARSSGMSPLFLPHGDRERACARMRHALEGPKPCATAFDGPIGPPRRVKPALVELASELGAEILTLAVSARPRLIQLWRWDARELPLPFARVSVRLGEPIRVPAALRREECAEWCEEVGNALDGLDASGERLGIGAAARRFVAAAGGVTLLVLGLVLAFAPGPATLVLILGLATLSAEFAWARRWLRKLRSAASLTPQGPVESDGTSPPGRGGKRSRVNR